MNNQSLDNRAMCKLVIVVTLFFMTLSTHSLANTPKDHRIELSGAGGLNWLNTKETTVIISSIESDRLPISRIDNHGAWKLGVGYNIPVAPLEQLPFFSQMLLEVNLYQTSARILSHVWQYDLTIFDNYQAQARVKSTRLMFDIKPQVLSNKKLSPYLIFGIGASWNKLSYVETITGTEVPPHSNLILGNRTTAQLAGEVGIGAMLKLNHQLSLTAEYIGAFIGNASPMTISENHATLSKAPSFSLQTQTLLFGVKVCI